MYKYIFFFARLFEMSRSGSRRKITNTVVGNLASSGQRDPPSWPVKLILGPCAPQSRYLPLQRAETAVSKMPSQSICKGLLDTLWPWPF